MPQPIEIRVQMLEERVTSLEELPPRKAGLELQIVQLRTEMHAGFSAVRGQICSVDVRLESVEAGLREGIRSVETGLREEIRSVEAGLRDNEAVLVGGVGTDAPLPGTAAAGPSGATHDIPSEGALL